MSVIKHTQTIPIEWAGERLDKVLAQLFPDYSRSRLSRWIKDGAVTLDAAHVHLPRHRVLGGEELMLSAHLEQETATEPQAMPLAIVHEDDAILVLCKPAGLVVHPGAGNADGTLLNGLLAYLPALSELPRGGIVHRLDKDTSGLMVVAKSLPAHTHLVSMFAAHDVVRYYEAVVKGSMISGGHVDAPLGRHPHDRIRQAVRDEPGGKPALTHYRLREHFRAHTLIRCQLETGRTHQIRVHMAHIGHGLVGDRLYGGHVRLPRGADASVKNALKQFPRQALHAEALAFAHPISGESMTFSAPRPADMDALVTQLRHDYHKHADSAHA